jgi:hypothetical protein
MFRPSVIDRLKLPQQRAYRDAGSLSIGEVKSFPVLKMVHFQNSGTIFVPFAERRAFLNGKIFDFPLQNNLFLAWHHGC